MFKWIKKLVNSKISITINIVTKSDGIPLNIVTKSDGIPQPTVVTSKKVTSLPNSYRFVNDYKKSVTGKEDEYWYTEIFENGRWRYMVNSLSHDKNKALDLHLIMSNPTNSPEQIKTVLWEGMPNDKVEAWVNLNRKE